MGLLKYALPLTVGVGAAVGLGYMAWTMRDRVLDYSRARTYKVLYDRQQTQAIRVPTHLVPQLIGTGGEAVHQLQADTHTQIHFGDEIKYDEDLDPSALDEAGQRSDLSSDDDWVDEPPLKKAKKSGYLGHRVMIITGSPDGINQVTKMVNELIKENTVESVPIPDGCNVVGSDGNIIHRIQDQSGAKLKVEGHRFTTNRVVLVIGNDEERAEAKKLIQEVVDEFRKEEQSTGDH